MARLLGFLSILLSACGAGEATRVAADTTDVVVPLQPYFRDLRVVSAVLGGDTARLLLDTGGGATLVTPAVATRLGCVPYGADIGHRMSGEQVAFARCDSAAIELGNDTLRLAPVAVFDINALLPRELPPLDGILALDAFVGHVVTLDLVADRLIVHAPDGEAAAATTSLPWRAATGQAGRFLTAFLPVAGKRGTLWFLLDSGNLRGTLVAESVVRDALLPLADSGKAILAVGNRLSDTTTWSPAPLIIDGALGSDFLRRHAVTLDLRDPFPGQR